MLRGKESEILEGEDLCPTDKIGKEDGEGGRERDLFP